MNKLSALQILSLVISASSLNLIACERQKMTSKVLLQMPSQVEMDKLKGLSSGTGKVSVQGNQGGSFGQAIPTDISEYNCYALFVGGATPELSSKACTKGAGSSFEKFTFGKMIGFAKLGSTFEVELDTLAGIRFYMLGAYSATGSCPELKDIDNSDTSHVSNPMILGKTVVDLIPGTMNIAIPVSVPQNLTSQMIQGCSFMGTGGTPSAIEIDGAISSHHGDASRVGSGVCNRMRIYPKVQNGDLLLEEDTAMSLNVGSGLVGQFYSNSTCTIPTTSATLVRGERSVDSFFKSVNSGSSGQIIVSGAFSGTTITSQVSVEVMTPGTASRFRFFESQLSLSSGSCIELNYLTQDSNGTSTAPPPLSLGATKLDGSSLTGVTYEFRNTCNGSSVGTTTNDVDSIYFYLGSTVKDMMLTLGGQGFTYVNVQPTASKLQLAATNINPYASDCTALSIQALNGSGGAADLSGTDFQGIVKRIVGNLDFISSNVQKFDYPGCTTPSSTHQFQITGPSSNVNQYLSFSSVNPVVVNVWGDAFLSSNQSAAGVVLTPKWDPGLLSNAVTFFAKVSDSNYYAMNNQNAAGGAWSWGGGAGTVHVPAGLGSEAILEVPQASGMGANTFPYATSFSYGLLVKFSDLTPTAPGSHFIASVANDGGGGYFYGSLSFTGTVGQLILTDRVSGSPQTTFLNVNVDQWYSVVVVHDPSTYTCKLYLDGASSSNIACDSTHPMFTYGINPPPAGKLSLAEHFILNRAVTPAEVANYHTYLKSRYPAAGLP